MSGFTSQHLGAYFSRSIFLGSSALSAMTSVGSCLPFISDPPVKLQLEPPLMEKPSPLSISGSCFLCISDLSHPALDPARLSPFLAVPWPLRDPGAAMRKLLDAGSRPLAV